MGTKNIKVSLIGIAIFSIILLYVSRLNWMVRESLQALSIFVVIFIILV